MKKTSLLLTLFFCCSFAYCQETYQAKTQLNIREGIGVKNSVVGKLEKGQKVQVDEITSGWGRVIVDGETKGYVSMRFLTTDIQNETNAKDSSNDSTIFFVCLIGIAIIYQFILKKRSTRNSYSKPFSKRIIPMKWFFLQVLQ